MDVKDLGPSNKAKAGKINGVDRRRRRALARLGLASPGAYVAPTLLSLRSTVTAASNATEVGAAA